MRKDSPEWRSLKRDRSRLGEKDHDRLLSEIDDPEIIRRLTFVKNLQKGDGIEETAEGTDKSNLDRQSVSTPLERR